MRKSKLQEINSINELDGGEEGAEFPAYAFVLDESPVGNRETVTLNQGIDVERKEQDKTGGHHEISSIYELNGDEDVKEDHVYASVLDESPIGNRETVTLNQGLDVESRERDRTGERHEISSIYDLNGDEDIKEDCVYAFVLDESPIGNRETVRLNQGLDVESRECDRAGERHEISSIYDLNGDEDVKEDRVYAFVLDESPIGNTETLNQGLDVESGCAQERKEEPQEINNIYELNDNEEAKEDHVYAFVLDESSISTRETQYQELDVKTQDYVSVYTQLTGGTYQELDLHSREEEHHYQTAEGGRN